VTRDVARKKDTTQFIPWTVQEEFPHKTLILEGRL